MGKIVLITGASSGIGEATARHLAEHGCTVVLGARRIDRLKALVAQIEVGGGRATAHPLDVTDREDVRAFVEKARTEYGRVDVLINNAGIMPLSPLSSGKIDEWERMVDVNVRGLLYGINAVLPIFAEQCSGHVVTIASVGAHQVSPTAAVYCGTKYGAWAITEGLRQESEPWLRVSTITPGVVESELAQTITDEAARQAMAVYRANVIPPSAIARAIGFAIDQPAEVDVNEIVVRPTAQR